MNVSTRLSDVTGNTVSLPSKSSNSNFNHSSRLMRWLLSFIVIAMGASMNSVNAQSASNYSWATLTGQSLLSIGTPTNLTTVANGSVNDGNNIITLPFTFTYNNIAYTQMTVTTNGYIVPGSVPGATGTSASLFLGTPGNPAFSAFGRDGNMNTSNGGSLDHGLSGTDVYVFQYNKLAGASGGSATIYGTLQIALYGPASSSPGKVEFIYGTSAGTFPTGTQIGIRDANGGYLNGLDGSSASTTTSSTFPASGTLYSFVPPPPCVGPIDQPDALNLTPSGLSVVNGSFSVAAPAPTGYLVVRTTSNTAPVPVDGTNYTVGNNAIGYIESVGASTTFTSTGLLASTQYYYWVFSYNNTSCSGGPLFLAANPLPGNITTGACSISGTKIVGFGGDYNNLTDAVAALVNNGVAGPVYLELNNAYPGSPETFPIVLPAVPCASAINTITIRLAGGATPKTITSSSTTSTFDINGGQYWIIDGRPGGSGSARDLTISNTSTATGGAAIRFINEASNNTVRYTVLKSQFSSTSVAMGTVFFSSTTGTNGNDNNTITLNDIDGGAAATASPTTGVAQYGVYSAGTTASVAQNNSNNSITNNNIFNQFITGAAYSCAGVWLSSGTTDWTISGNSFYQTSTRTAITTAGNHYAIRVDNASSGNNFVISNNFIGGNSANATGTLTIGGTISTRYTAIGLNVGTTTATSVQGNTIRGHNFSSSVSSTTITTSTAVGSTWSAIILAAGSANIGTTSGNTIGNPSSTGSITITVSGSASSLVFPVGFAGSGIVNFSNNTIAGITGTNSVLANYLGARMVYSTLATPGVLTISNNTLGSLTTANSINFGSGYTGSSTAMILEGIYTVSTARFQILNNTLSNFTMPTSTTPTSTGTSLRGIFISSGFGSVEGNTIANLFSSYNGTGAINANAMSVMGISWSASTAGGDTIRNNTIYNLSNTHPTGATSVAGIVMSSLGNGANFIENNTVYGLNNLSSSTSSRLLGISTVATSNKLTISNNMVALGRDITGASITSPALLTGIRKDGTGATNIFHNTVYFGGTAVASINNSVALRRVLSSSVQDSIWNNIFINNRSNASGSAKHYTASFDDLTLLSCNYNLHFGNGTGYSMGAVGASDYSTLALLKAAFPSQNANSLEADPCLAAPDAATPDLHLTDCATLGSPADGNGGVMATAVPNDFEGQVRASLSPIDMGADAGNYGASGLDVGSGLHIRPTATSCHSANEDLVVELKNFSTNLIDFSLNPVTITTNVTGQITAGPFMVTLNSGTLAAGSSMNVTMGQINTTANGTYNIASSASVTGDVTPGNNASNVAVVINYSPLTVSINPTSPNVCFTGGSVLTSTVAGGTQPYTYLWSGGTTPTAATDSTGTITSTQNYFLTVTDACGVIAISETDTVTVFTPTVTATAPNSRCGVGSVALGATADAGSTLNWYTDATGGLPIGSGTSFNTPSISTSTNFYVAANNGGSYGITIPGDGGWNHVTTTGGFQSSLITGAYMVLTVLQPFVLSSVDIYPSATLGTSFTIEARTGSASGTAVQSWAGITTVVNSGSPTIAQTVPLNWSLTPGTYYIGFPVTNPSTWRSGVATHTFPWVLPGYASLDYYLTPSYQYYFYNLKLSTPCESPRQAVLATVTPPPAITVTPGTAISICQGQSVNLSVSSANADYAYNWTPGAFLGAGPYSVSPTTTTSYTVSAVDTLGGTYNGCVAQETIVVTVNPTPGPVTITPASPVTDCVNGSGTSITATSNSLSTTTGIIGTGTSTNSTTTPYRGASGGSRSQFLYDAADLTALGMGENSKINALSMKVLSFTSPYKYAGFTIKMKHTAATTLTATIEQGLTTVFAVDTFELSGTAPFTVSHTLQTPFVWNGADNIVIEFCFNRQDAGGVSGNSASIESSSITGKTAYGAWSSIDSVCTRSSGFSTSTLRVNMGFAFNIEAPITWSPVTGLNTAVGNTVIAHPATSTLYTATATLGACSAQNTIQVNVSDLAVNVVGTTDAICNGSANGTLTAVGTGGTGPYNYVIAGPTVNTTGASTGVFTGLTAGNYTVTITDAKPCSVTSTVAVVGQPVALTLVAIDSTAPICYNGNNGTLTVLGAGGTGGWVYAITAGPTINTSGAATGFFTGLTPGAYTVSVTDANNCVTFLNINVNNTTPIPVTPSNNGPVCAGTDINLTIAETYVSYSWTGPGIINNASMQSATAVAPANGDVFTITVTDANGCQNSASTTVSVTALAPVSATISASPGTDNCAATPVTFTVTPVNGGTTPTFQWYLNGNPVSGATSSTYLTDSLNDQDQVYCIVTSDIVCTSGNPANSNTLTMTVSPFVNSDVTLAASANPTCAGTSITFTATPLYGGATPTYEFFVNAISVQGPSASNTYSYVPANGDVVTVTLVSSLTCSLNGTVSSAPETMTVNPVPAAATVTPSGATTFCAGNSVTLTSSYAGAGNQWYKDGNLLGSETNDNLVVTTSGSYTVVYTALGCSSAVSTPVVVTVYANPVVSITGPTSVCSNEFITLSANASPGSGTLTGFQWIHTTLSGSTNLGTSATQETNIGGDYTVVVTNSNGCSTTSAIYNVTAYPAPVATITGNTEICTGTTEVLDASTSIAYNGIITNYQWQKDGSNVGTNSTTYTANVAGNYRVIVTNTVGCKDTSDVFALTTPLAPMSGVYTVNAGQSASCSNFTSLANAILNLNTRGVNGNVTFDIVSGHTETAPTGGLVINYCGLNEAIKPSASQTVTFQGGTVAATITAPVGTSTTVDGIVSLVGADFITFDKVNLVESASNTTATTRMEWGYALLKCDGTDGANNNTISNCSITLNKANTPSKGIYTANHNTGSTTAITYSGTAGDLVAVEKYRSSRNVFKGNAIQNAYTGISLNGNSASSAPYSLNDTLNTIGLTGAGNGNTVTDFGGSTSAVAAITEANQRGIRVRNNTVNGGAGTTGTTVIGIQVTSGVWGEVTDNNITVLSNGTTSAVTGLSVALAGGSLADPNIVVVTGNTVTGTYTTATTGSLIGITSGSSGTGSVVTISNNTVQNMTHSGTGTFTGIANTSTPGTLTLANNLVTGNTKNSTGTMNLLASASTGAVTVNNNLVHNNQVSGGSAAVTMNCINIGTASVGATVYDNQVYNNRVVNMSGTSAATVYGIYNSSTSVSETYYNNTVHSLYVTGAASPSTAVQAVRGMYHINASTSTRSVYNNRIYNLYTSSNISGAVMGIYSSTANVSRIYKNKVYDLFAGQQAAGAAFIRGIQVISGSDVQVYNNLVDINMANATAPAANGVLVGNTAVAGIDLAGVATNGFAGFYFNTVRVSGAGSGTGFGSAGFFVSSASTSGINYSIRNNIVINNTVGGGTGVASKAAAFRRVLTSFPGYNNNSNNNIWYVAGTANSPYYFDGTNGYNTMTDFKAQVAPRESASAAENVAFQSTDPLNANFLKVDTGIPTAVESGALPIGGITDDYFGTVRNVATPDIGAHEDNFLNAALVVNSATVSPTVSQCTAVAHTVTTVLTPGINPISSVNLNYSVNGIPQTAIPMTLVSGTTYTGIIPVPTPVNAVITWFVSASDGVYTANSAVGTYQDEQLLGVSFPIAAAPTQVCSGGAATLTTEFLVSGVTGTGASTSSTYSNPFYSLYSNSHNQHLVKAAELTAAGYIAGPVTGIGLDITSAGTLPMKNVSLKVGQMASAGDLNSWKNPVFQTVFTTGNLLPVSGLNMMSFSSPFNWDGTSDLIIDFCHDSLTTTATMSRTAKMDATAYVSTIHAHRTSTTGILICPDTITNRSVYFTRPQFTILGTKGLTGFTVNWYDSTTNALVGTGNSITVNPLATTKYYASATSLSTGCTMPSTDTTTVSVLALTCNPIQVSPVACANGQITLTASPNGGAAPYSYSWSDGSATVYPNSANISPNLPAGTYTFSVTITDVCGSNCTTNLLVTINPLPTVTVGSDPVNGEICGTAAVLTASGANTYTWAPATGLTATTGTSVQAIPAVTTTYTVSGTDVNGCVGTATQTITRVTPALAINASSLPSVVCSGTNSVQLNAGASIAAGVSAYYSFSASTGNSLEDTTTAVNVLGTGQDDTPAAGLPIGFNFVYEGQTFTHFSAAPDGYIQLRNDLTAASSDFSNDMANPVNKPTIGAYWEDLHTGTDGSVKYVVSGTAPNRRLVIHWYVTIPRNTAGPANGRFQMVLHESSNNIDFIYGNTPVVTTLSGSIGLTSHTITGSYFNVNGEQDTASSIVVLNSNTSVPAAGKKYSFMYNPPVALSYSWTPATNLSATNISNPVATNLVTTTSYIVSATHPVSGCSVKDTVTVTVNPTPVASFTAASNSVCVNAAPVSLTPTNAGGTFSGTGVSGSLFFPATAGVGTHKVYYTLIDNGTGCTGIDSTTITVNALPVVSFSGLSATICANAGAVTLVGSPAGGTFSGTGISGNSFDPAVAGAGGPYTITYSYTDGNNCSASATQNVTVYATPSVSFSGLNATYCVNAAAATLTGSPAGGTFSGTGISGNTFDPATAGVGGPYSITYSYTDGNGCTATNTQTVTVNALPVVSFSGLSDTYCVTDAASTLTGSPAGGTFSGTGISGNVFDPAVATAGGPYTITYSYTDVNGCSASSSDTVTVQVCTPPTIVANLKFFLQGYYIDGGIMQPVLLNQGIAAGANETDTVTIELYDATTYALVEAQQAVLTDTGYVSATFNAPTGSYYYGVRHRNSVFTWSAVPVTVTASTPLYDFSSAASQALGDNQVLLQTGIYGFYTGDINQDEYIDGNDFPPYDTDNLGGVNTVYVATDLNGDGYVDGNDFPLYDNNNLLGISSVHY